MLNKCKKPDIKINVSHKGVSYTNWVSQKYLTYFLSYKTICKKFQKFHIFSSDYGPLKVIQHVHKTPKYS